MLLTEYQSCLNSFEISLNGRTRCQHRSKSGQKAFASRHKKPGKSPG